MKRTHFKHFALASVSALTLLLAACGGGGGTTNVAPTLAVVAFGDSLTDGGTYKDASVADAACGGFCPFTFAQIGGGKFITNNVDPVSGINSAKTWAEIVADGLATSSTFGPAAAEGFDLTYAPVAEQLNYAQGGSRVTLANNGATVVPASATPVVTQVDRYLNDYTKFNSRQLILINAGANDLFQSPVPATFTVAASELADQALRIQNNGGERILVASLPDMGLTPSAFAGGPAVQTQYTALSNGYNTALKAALDAKGVRYVWLDVSAWFRTTIANAASHGITNTTGKACGGSSLGCSPYSASNLTGYQPGTDMTYAFADDVHPSTKMHQLFGAFALTAIRAQGW